MHHDHAVTTHDRTSKSEVSSRGMFKNWHVHSIHQ